MSGKLVQNIIEPSKKKLADIWRMILNLKDKNPTDTRRDSFGGSKVIGHAGTQQDPAKVFDKDKKIEEEKNDK